jgi:hypothetical protein
MRLTVALFVLVVTALDFRFGRPTTALHIAALVAGALLAASIVIDRLLREPGEGAGRRRAGEASSDEHRDEMRDGDTSKELPSNPG